MSREQILRAIDEEISKLQQVKKLLSSSEGTLASKLTTSKKPHAARNLSAEARARIAAAQKRRWAKQKREAASR